MSDLRRWEYGDPLRVLERREGQNCTGCAHSHARPDPFGGVHMVCKKGRKHGKRCRRYEEKRNDRND